MAKDERTTWSVDRIQHPKYPGYTVRIGEHAPGGTLQVFRWVNGLNGRKGRQTQRSLKKTRAALVADLLARGLKATANEQEREARRLGSMYIEELAAVPELSSTPSPSGGPFTLRALAARYEGEAFAGRTPNYKRDAVAALARIQKVLGDVVVPDITPNAVKKYMERRKQEGHAPAGRSDLVALSIAINWAIGEKLLKENALADKKVREAMRITGKPSRPVADKARYELLRAKADEVAPAFGVILDLAWHTGHRISAILGLRWQDVSFKKTAEAPNGTITWYAGATTDNKKHEHTLPMNTAARTALMAWRKETGGIAWAFPSEKDPANSVERHTTKQWLRRAEKLAKLEHLKHGGWHIFRRGWATTRKSFPLKDVAEGMGSRDTQSVLECYQHADSETTKLVVLKVV
jgi:integrase